MQTKINLEKKLNLEVPSPLHFFNLSKNSTNDVKFLIKRDDQIHPIVSGNKWRKLKYNLETIVDKKIQQVISFGGAWSNHLHALGWCCKQLEIDLIVFVRGEATDTPSAMIQDLIDWGVTIKWLNRKQYRQKSDPDWLSYLATEYPQAEIIPEGGSNSLALKGIAELAEEVKKEVGKIDYICAAVGSGGTLAGLIDQFSTTDTKLIGIPVLKSGDSLQLQIESLIQSESNNWQLLHGYELGGYAKYDQSLADFIVGFQQQNKILLEPIYTAKLMRAVEDLNQKHFFHEGSTVVVLHSGGLQGLRGDNKFKLKKLLET